MKITIDTDNQTLITQNGKETQEVSLFSKKAFEILSLEWVKVGWDQKYPYTFSWMGRPIIQLPEDMIRTQEVIYKIKPNKIIETGVAHGGSLIYYASLMKAFGIEGKVIGVDIEIRPHNKKAIAEHELSYYLHLIEGDSASTATLDKVKALVNPDDRVLVILDSNHSKDHVTKELEAYNSLVTPGSYIVATDGVMQWVHQSKRAKPDWVWDNPSTAAVDFVSKHKNFRIEQPEWPFNESQLRENITHWPSAWIKRLT